MCNKIVAIYSGVEVSNHVVKTNLEIEDQEKLGSLLVAVSQLQLFFQTESFLFSRSKGTAVILGQ